MIKLYGKIVKKNNIVQNSVFEMQKDHMDFKDFIFKGLESLCYKFDIGYPIWLSNNENDMNQVNKTKFKAQQFIEDIDFDYLEIEYVDDRI